MTPRAPRPAAGLRRLRNGREQRRWGGGTRRPPVVPGRPAGRLGGACGAYWACGACWDARRTGSRVPRTADRTTGWTGPPSPAVACAALAVDSVQRTAHGPAPFRAARAALGRRRQPGTQPGTWAWRRAVAVADCADCGDSRTGHRSHAHARCPRRPTDAHARAEICTRGDGGAPYSPSPLVRAGTGAEEGGGDSAGGLADVARTRRWRPDPPTSGGSSSQLAARLVHWCKVDACGTQLRSPWHSLSPTHVPGHTRRTRSPGARLFWILESRPKANGPRRTSGRGQAGGASLAALAGQNMPGSCHRSSLTGGRPASPCPPGLRVRSRRTAQTRRRRGREPTRTAAVASPTHGQRAEGPARQLGRPEAATRRRQGHRPRTPRPARQGCMRCAARPLVVRLPRLSLHSVPSSPREQAAARLVRVARGSRVECLAPSLVHTASATGAFSGSSPLGARRAKCALPDQCPFPALQARRGPCAEAASADGVRPFSRDAVRPCGPGSAGFVRAVRSADCKCRRWGGPSGAERHTCTEGTRAWSCCRTAQRTRVRTLAGGIRRAGGSVPALETTLSTLPNRDYSSDSPRATLGLLYCAVPWDVDPRRAKPRARAATTAPQRRAKRPGYRVYANDACMQPACSLETQTQTETTHRRAHPCAGGSGRLRAAFDLLRR